jgi:hypothetical protein
LSCAPIGAGEAYRTQSAAIKRMDTRMRSFMDKPSL